MRNKMMKRNGGIALKCKEMWCNIFFLFNWSIPFNSTLTSCHVQACFLHFIRFVFVVKTLLAVKYDIWYIHMKGMSYNSYIGQYLPLFLVGDPWPTTCQNVLSNVIQFRFCCFCLYYLLRHCNYLALPR